MLDLSCRATMDELMDDFSRPEAEFSAAYRGLGQVNRYLGGFRAVRRFVPFPASLFVLDVGAGACDIGDRLADDGARVVALDLNPRGLGLVRHAWPVVGDALDLPFRDEAFDVVMASLFFHHLSDDECVTVLRQMFRVARRTVIVNDLHRHRMAYHAFRCLSLLSTSVMIRNDGPISIRRAFRPGEMLEIASRAGVRARVHRSFPYRLILVAEK